MNKDKKWMIIAGTVAAVAVVVVIWLALLNKKKGKEIDELKKYVDSKNDLTAEIKKQLTELISKNPDIDENLANELAQIAALLEIEKDTKAMLSLAKIIENLLKELYKNNIELKTLVKGKNRKNPTFEDYLNFAHDKGVISREDYHMLSVLKIIRNQEAHELNVKKDKGRIAACFIAGISTTFSLFNLLKQIRIK